MRIAVHLWFPRTRIITKKLLYMKAGTLVMQKPASSHGSCSKYPSPERGLGPRVEGSGLRA